VPKPTEELLLKNLHKMIIEQILQQHAVSKERQEGFDNGHDEVHVEVERELSSQNPRHAMEREQTTNINHITEFAHQANILEASQTSDMSFDRHQTAFTLAFWMLDSLLSSLDNSQELALRLDPESSQSTHLARSLSFILKNSQGLESQAAVFDITL